MLFYGRKRELAELKFRLDDSKSSFFSVKGRRRIGKSTLLKKLVSQYENTFYFNGIQNESNVNLMKRFAFQWGKFTDSNLHKLGARYLSWFEIFTEIGMHINGKKFIFILDEIQWINSTRNGFNGHLKDFWENHKNKENLKIIISGSSRRYFKEYVENQNAALYGTRTQSAIVVPPFSLSEIRKYYFPDWTMMQTALVYMMVGGIPYYLENIRYNNNFIRSIEHSFFQKRSLFLDEAREVMTAEYKRRPMVDKVMDTLLAMARGVTSEKNLVKTLKISQPNMNQILSYLLDLGFIQRAPSFSYDGNSIDPKQYFINDFFLFFYFNVLTKVKKRILNNTENIFSDYVLGSKKGYYIEGFSGQAFERLIKAHILMNDFFCPTDKPEKLFHKLNLQLSYDYEVREFSLPKIVQIDLIVEGKTDHEFRFIEVKWTHEPLSKSRYNIYIKKLKERSNLYHEKSKKLWQRSYYIAVPKSNLKDQHEILQLEDLF